MIKKKGRGQGASLSIREGKDPQGPEANGDALQKIAAIGARSGVK